ncbi:glycosyltransferase family 2 protein [Dehalococcoidia bacterium]|nr:glycosyltransferase family 2 protein [Dehalococcoidia bacterium]
MAQQVKKVSVIVVNFNGMSHLEVCISSILNQTYRDFEIIFVDNGSTDGSLDYARRRFPELIVVANRDNLGYAGGINEGLKLASGEYIAAHNTDTEVDEHWLAHMVRFLDENQKAGAVTPKILLYHDRAKLNALGLNIHITGVSFVRALNEDSKNYSNGHVRVSGVSGCSYLIRREILEKIGGVPDICFMNNDDTVLSWILNLMGYEIYCIPQSVIYHKYQLKMDPEKFFRLDYTRYTMLLSTFKPVTFLICLLALAFTEMLMVGYCLIRGRPYMRAYLKALFSVYQNRDSLKRRRAQLQQLRRVSDIHLLTRLRLNYEWNQLLQILT